MKLTPLLRFLWPLLMVGLLAGCSAESRRAKQLERAGQHYRAKDYAKAQIEYQNILATEPNHLEANERLAEIWLARGSPVRAAGFLTKLRTVAPGNLEARLKLARIIHSLGGVEEARREAKEIVERSSSHPEALVLLSESVRSADDLKQLEALLERVREKGTVSFLIASGNLQAMKGDAEGARATLLRAVARDPKGSDARLAVASLLANQGLGSEARDEFKRAMDLDPANGNVRMRYAGYLVQTGAVAEAVTFLTETARQLPDFLPPWRALAEIAIDARRFDDARNHLQALLAKDGADYEGRILQAKLWAAEGDAKRAIADLEKFGQDFPGLGIEKYQLALAYLQNNDPAAALRTLQEVVARQPDHLEAHLQLAQLLMRAGQLPQAGSVLVDVISRRPTFAPAYPLLIDALRSVGQLEKVLPALERAVKLMPRSAPFHYMLGAVQNQLQRPQEARRSYEQALKVDPGHQTATAELIALDLKEGRMADALTRAQALVDRVPRSAPARVILARVHVAGKNWDPAEAVLLEAIALDPASIGAYGLLADVFRARKDDAATSRRVDAFLEQRRDDELATVVAGQFYAHVGQQDRARQIFERFLAAKPQAAEVLNNLANVQLETFKEYDRALETARRARAAAPGSPAIADTLGWALYHKQAYAEALPLLQEAAARLGQLPEVQYHLGMVQLRLGQVDAAREALRKAVAGAGTYAGKDEARRELEALERR